MNKTKKISVIVAVFIFLFIIPFVVGYYGFNAEDKKHHMYNGFKGIGYTILVIILAFGSSGMALTGMRF